MRRQDIVVHLDKDGQTQYTGYHVKILHASALQIGNLSIAWNPNAGAPTVHLIKVYRDGETIDVLSKASFEVIRREDQLEAAKLDGMLTAVLRIPDLRVGDELEFGLTTPGSDPTLGKNDAGLLFLGPGPLPGRYRLGLGWDKSRQPNIKLTADMEAAAQRREDAIEFRFDNPPVQTPPKDAPARFQWQRIVEYSTFRDWPSISRHFAPLFAAAAEIPADSSIKQEVARIAAAHSDPLERARAALKLVQQDVRYIYVGLDGGNLKPASADDTWQRRYGDCKGKTTLLLGLLAALGIDAEAVLVNSRGTDDGLNARLPNPQMFDHVLVRARIDGDTYWLDGTLPPVAPPSAKPVFPLRWVLPLTDRGDALEALAWEPATTPDEVTLFEIDARGGFVRPARITNTSIVRGVKGLQNQLQFSALAPAQLLTAFRQQLIGSTWQSIDDVRWHYDQAAAASVLTIKGTGTIDWDDADGGKRSLALPGGGFSPPERRVRSADQDQELPYYNAPEYTCHVTTVRLPSSTQQKQWSFNSSYDVRMFGRNYYRAFDMRDGAVRMVRGSRIEQQEIDAAAAQKDNVRIAAFDNSMAWIYYDPAGRGGRASVGRKVPATDEIDWTGGDVPCVSSISGS
jgi:hypothetical protein